MQQKKGPKLDFGPRYLSSLKPPQRRGVNVLCSEAILVNSGSDGGQAVTLKCRRWSCDICRPGNRWEVIRKAEDGKPTTFLTLTVNPSRYECPDDAARDLKEAFVKLRKEIKKKYDIDKLPFIAVFERTQAGWPHMHLLIRSKYIHWKWISLVMKRLIGAQCVDIRRITKRKGAAHYISKYIGKDPHSFVGCKRWWRSHNYDLGREPPADRIKWGHRWEKAEVHLSRYREVLEDNGCTIVEERRGFIRWKDEYPEWTWTHRQIAARYRRRRPLDAAFGVDGW